MHVFFSKKYKYCEVGSEKEKERYWRKHQSVSCLGCCRRCDKLSSIGQHRIGVQRAAVRSVYVNVVLVVI